MSSSACSKVEVVLEADQGTAIQDLDFFKDRIVVWLRREGVPGLAILPLSGISTAPNHDYAPYAPASH